MSSLIVWMGLVGSSLAVAGEYDDYAQALKAARAQGRLLVVVLQEGAQPSRATPVGRSAALLRKHFVVCRVNVNTPYGAALAKAFGCNRFPHLAVIDAREMVILHRHTGPVDTQQVQLLVARWSSAPASSRSGSASPAICFT